MQNIQLDSNHLKIGAPSTILSWFLRSLTKDLQRAQKVSTHKNRCELRSHGLRLQAGLVRHGSGGSADRDALRQIAAEGDWAEKYYLWTAATCPVDVLWRPLPRWMSCQSHP